MIELFRKNDISSMILLLPFTVVMRLYSLIYPTSYLPLKHTGYFSEWFFNYFIEYPISQAVLAIVLIYFQAVLINISTNNNKIFYSQNGIPGYLYILFTGMFVGQQTLSPAIIAMTFVLFASLSVFNVYKKNEATKPIFNASIYLTIATLIYPPCVFLLLAHFIELFVLRSMSIKEILQFAFGIAIFFWIIGAALFYFGNLSSDMFFNWDLFGSSSLLIPKSINESWPLAIITISIVTVLSSQYGYMKKKGIESRKKIDFYFWVMLFTLFTLFFYASIDFSILVFLALPLSILISMNLADQKNLYRTELINLLLLSTAFLSLYAVPLNLFSLS